MRTEQYNVFELPTNSTKSCTEIDNILVSASRTPSIPVSHTIDNRTIDWTTFLLVVKATIKQQNPPVEFHNKLLLKNDKAFQSETAKNISR